MSIEQQLQAAFRKDAGGQIYPRRLDLEVEQSVQPALAARRQRAAALGGRSVGGIFPFGLKKVAVFALVILLLSGFAFGATKLYEMKDNGVRIEVFADPSLQLTQISGEEVRQTLQQVKEQLAPGELGVIYFEKFTEEPNALLSQFPGVVVHRPVEHSDWGNWRMLLPQTGQTELTPTLGGQYRFAVGKEGSAQDVGFAPEAVQVMEELQKKAEQAGKTLDWAKVEHPTSFVDEKTTLYQAASGEEIYVTLQKLETGTDFKVTTDNDKLEKAQIHGEDVYYSENRHFLSDTGKVKDVSWMAGAEGAPVMVHLGTESTSITKEQLLAIAEELLSGN